MPFLSKPKSVDAITAPIGGIVQQLHDHAVARDDEAAKAGAAIVSFTAAKDAAEKEAARAREVAGRISSLVA